MDYPARQAGMDHNVDFTAIVPKKKPATSLLDVCLIKVRLMVGFLNFYRASFL